MKFLLQKMSGFQNGCDMAHLVRFECLIVFIFQYLKGSEIWKMAIADCVLSVCLWLYPLTFIFL